MKKKSPRGIPDFSSKGPKSKIPGIVKTEKPQQKFNTPQPKPQATSIKSGGRRGG